MAAAGAPTPLPPLEFTGGSAESRAFAGDFFSGGLSIGANRPSLPDNSPAVEFRPDSGVSVSREAVALAAVLVLVLVLIR